MCTRCGLKQWVSSEGPTEAARKQCPHQYKGKDPWIHAIIAKFAPSAGGFFQPKQANHNQNTKAQTGETKPKPTHSLQAPANAEHNEPSQTGLDGKEHRSSCSLGEAWGLQTRQPKPKSEPFDAKMPKPKAPAKPRAKVKPDANQAKLKF